ncbi:MAG: hypothetical protein HY908_23360, partial [Myxococcales bacterium]|nr:hypothetical protein [Myxococcales bacterium]
MEPPDLTQEIDDLEPRIERLRSLYEQYFMGFEKTEPGTLRRDLDRKLWVLRRTRIQNTSLRFKLQMLIQRYNTYQQYWSRITREIESGTYMRDVLKTAKRIGATEAATIVGRRRAKMFQRLAEKQLARQERRRGTPDGGEPERGLEPAEAEASADHDALDGFDEAPTPPAAAARGPAV